MKKFFKITAILYRNALIRDLQLSGQVISGALTHLMDGFISIALILIVYSKTDSIGGWSIYETLILITTMQIIGMIHSSWTKRGTANFAQSMVRTGDYDFFLTKPFDPMIAISINRPRIYNLIKLPFYLFIFIYAVLHLGRIIPLTNVLWFVLLFICGFLIYYAIRIITIVPAFWIIKSWSLTMITDRVQNIIKYPATIYPRMLTVIFSTIFPIFAIAYLPVKTLLFEPKLSYIVYMVSITLIFLAIARWLWKIGERNYGSASS